MSLEDIAAESKSKSKHEFSIPLIAWLYEYTLRYTEERRKINKEIRQKGGRNAPSYLFHERADLNEKIERNRKWMDMIVESVFCYGKMCGKSAEYYQNFLKKASKQLDVIDQAYRFKRKYGMSY